MKKLQDILREDVKSSMRFVNYYHQKHAKPEGITRDNVVMDNEHEEALQRYKGSAYRSLNKWHRGDPKFSPHYPEKDWDENDYRRRPTMENLMKWSYHLDKATRGHTLDRGTHLWRGLDPDVDHHEWNVGDVIKDHGYMSTSLSHNFAKTWPSPHLFGHMGKRGALLRIHAPRGTKGFFLSSRFNDGEHEVLLPRKTAIKITKVERPDHGLHLIHAKIHSQEDK